MILLTYIRTFLFFFMFIIVVVTFYLANSDEQMNMQN